MKKEYFILISIAAQMLSYNNLTPRIITEEEVINECEEIKTCYECNSPTLNCEWRNAGCLFNKSETIHWFNKLLQCTDDISTNKTFEYCQIDSKDDKDSDAFWLKQTNKLYGAKGLFCIFTFPVEKKVAQLTLSYLTRGYLGLKTIDDKDEEAFYDDFPKNYKIEELKNTKEIIIYYYGEDYSEDSPPFIIQFIKLKKRLNLEGMIAIPVIFGIIIFAILMTVLVVLFMSYFKQRNVINETHHRHAKRIDEDIHYTPGRTNQIILDSIVFDEEKNMMFNEKCPVCLEKIEPKKKVIILNCSHGFHNYCLRKWMEKNNNLNNYCPFCHIKIVENDRERTEGNMINPQV